MLLTKPSLAQITGGGFRAHPRYMGCVGHWMFNEGGGLTAYDISGYQRHGTLTGGPTWVGGAFGAALSFDGTDDYISIGDQLLFTSAFTVSVWVREAANTQVQPFISQFSTGSNSCFSCHRWSDNRYSFDFTGTGTGGTYWEVTPITVDTIGVLHHVVYTYRGTATAAVQLYRDGTLLPGGALTGTIPASLFNSTQVVSIGRTEATSPAEFYNGIIEEIRVYNRTMLQGEIQSLYNDPFLEFRQPVRRVRGQAAAQARLLALLGVGQ